MKKLCTKKGKPKSQQTLKEKDTEIHQQSRKRELSGSEPHFSPIRLTKLQNTQNYCWQERKKQSPALLSEVFRKRLDHNYKK